jgi:hypothetical protein
MVIAIMISNKKEIEVNALSPISVIAGKIQ